MSRNYYVLKNAKLHRKDNTLYLEAEGIKKALPVEDIDSIYLYGETDLNTKLLNFFSQKNIALHVFNYYGYYSGTYYPRDYLNSGFLLVKQVEFYTNKKKRVEIAREFIKAGATNINKNLSYYSKRGRDFTLQKERIGILIDSLQSFDDTKQVMGIEGNIREIYYSTWDDITIIDEPFEKRTKRPPDNMLNCLISFGNSLLYALCVSEIYRTQLNPTISYLHEPGERRFSLALDIADIFKPVLVDRIIFKLLNTKSLVEKHFEKDLNYCYLNEDGRKIFLKEWEDKLQTTIEHRRLMRKISYQHIIRLECYKLIKHITGVEEFDGFKAWW